MKNIRRFISLAVSVCLLFAVSPGMIYAIEINDSLITENEVCNELNIRVAVNQYFEQRFELLSGKSDSIEVAVAAITADERDHLIKIQNAGVILISSEVSIDSFWNTDTYACVEVTETLSYARSGETYTETVSHSLTLGTDESNSLLIASDGYFATCSGFQSSSYVNTSSVSQMNTELTGAGGSCCVVHRAETEVGYVVPSDGYTKYNQWHGVAGGWCAMFATWCAHYAGVPQTVIQKISGPGRLRSFFVGLGTYYDKPTYPGYVPEPGDVLFMGTNVTNPNHVAIVRYVQNGTVYYVAGNHGTPATVALDYISLSSTSILGFGNPQYEIDGHDYSDTWSYNSSAHWRECLCGSTTDNATHSFTMYWNNDYHWSVCLCGKQTNRVAHVFLAMNGSTFVCGTCGYEKQ